MNDDRFQERIERLLDGELGADEANALAIAARSDPARRRELRQQLVTWELWSQQQAPERSADAFMQALRTRQRAEAEGEGFVTALHEQLKRVEPRTSVGHVFRRGFRRLWEGLYASTFSAARARQWVFRWGVVGTSAAAVALVVWLWTVPHAAHATVTLHGEAICTACTLHETHAHLPAIRVREGARTAIYYVDSGRLTVMRLGDYCVAPFPIVATGAPERHGDRTSIRVEAATREPRTRGANDSPDGRVLFPF